jgi:hypothetical protein
MRFFRPAAALAVALTAGCTTIPLPRLKDGPENNLERKPVIGKREPAQLVAEDGTTCHTTKSKYERARPGQRVWCVWQGEPLAGDQRTARW